MAMLDATSSTSPSPDRQGVRRLDGGLQWTSTLHPHAGRLHLLGGSLATGSAAGRSSSSGWCGSRSPRRVRRGAEHPDAHLRAGPAGRGACSPRARWRSSRPPSCRATGPGAVGAWSGLGGVAGRSGRSWAAGWSARRLAVGVPVEPAAGRAVVAVAVRHVPETADEDAHGRFDVLGRGVGALCLAGITYALTIFRKKGVSVPLLAGTAVAGITAGAAFRDRGTAAARSDAADGRLAPAIQLDQRGHLRDVRRDERVFFPAVLTLQGRPGSRDRGGHRDAAGDGPAAVVVGAVRGAARGSGRGCRSPSGCCWRPAGCC